MNKRQLLLGSLAAASLSKIGSSWAQASNYPNRAIHLIVPSEAGGGTDFTARTIGLKLTELLGQSLVVDNRPGAAGNIGVEQGVRATPDGYTLVMPITSLPMSPWLYSKLSYDPVKDLSPIILACAAPLIMVVNPQLPVNNVQEFIALAKKQPGQLNYANSGNGTTAHLAGELFKKMADIKMESVNYKGGGSSVIDTIAGRVQIYFSTIPAALPHLKSGKLRALAVTSKHRVEMIPDVPTVDESGLPGFEVVGWFGIFAPTGTPNNVILKLSESINVVLKMPEIRERLARQGLIPGGGTPEALRDLLNADLSKWGKLIKEIGLKTTE
ncbi:MAG: tripartite tricarboxylate transporter substrate binding protein [Alcaligenaceae bacterium]|nr:tripartite tricarboxylate transporter substrate binding protein [Alcaligenaceae bacterium]